MQMRQKHILHLCIYNKHGFYFTLRKENGEE